MAKELKFVMLLDCYGDLITPHQRNIMELYYCEDLSLAEIGDIMEITRQGVLSVLKRTENILTNYEEKLCFAQRLNKMKMCFDRLSDISEKISDEELKKDIKNEINLGLLML